MKIDTNKLNWEQLRENTLFKHLARDEEKNIQIDILKLLPNSKHPEHIHPEFEWVYVLEGSFEDERNEYKAGDFLINEKDSKHIAKAGPYGAKLLVLWCGNVNKT